jgi:hypothetical protein
MRSVQEVNVAETDDRYLAGDEFPVMDGERMCPRCRCCSVVVGSYHQPQALPGDRLRLSKFIPQISSLRREPDPSSGPEAWYCRGGCDKNGEHSKSWPEDIPTFIAYVKKSAASTLGPTP